MFDAPTPSAILQLTEQESLNAQRYAKIRFRQTCSKHVSGEFSLPFSTRDGNGTKVRLSTILPLRLVNLLMHLHTIM